MKFFAAIFAAFIFILIGHISVAAENVSFEYNTGDVGIIKTESTNKNSARSMASEQCFDRRLERYVQKRGELPDEAQADLMIDSCVNI